MIRALIGLAAGLAIVVGPACTALSPKPQVEADTAQEGAGNVSQTQQSADVSAIKGEVSGVHHESTITGADPWPTRIFAVGAVVVTPVAVLYVVTRLLEARAIRLAKAKELETRHTTSAARSGTIS